MQSPAPTAARFEVPAAVGQWLERLPAWPGSLLFVTALNLMLSRQLPGDVVQALQGRSLRIHVRDARIGFDFTWRGNGFLPRTRTRTHTPDLTISASAADFVALARREQDPDTLFFSRRLSMEGDTELGLMVKNTLDALDLPVFDPQKLLPPPPQVVLARIRGWFDPSRRA